MTVNEKLKNIIYKIRERKRLLKKMKHQEKIQYRKEILIFFQL